MWSRFAFLGRLAYSPTVRRMADRDLRQILVAPVQPRHWRVLIAIFRILDQPIEALARYLRNSGVYPWTVEIKTPTGRVALQLDTRHELLTLIEVFCRRDYGAGGETRVLDIGANVGIAALFWLTRVSDSSVVCVEPDPWNVQKLRRNLAGFAHRVEIVEAAVTPGAEGTMRFTPMGRYGHLDPEGSVEVETVTIDHLIDGETFDLVKIDTEGGERLLADRVFGVPVVFEEGRGVQRCLNRDQNANRNPGS